MEGDGDKLMVHIFMNSHLCNLGWRVFLSIVATMTHNNGATQEAVSLNNLSLPFGCNLLLP